MLSKADAERIIEEIYTKRAVSDENTKTLANLIRTDINDTLSGEKYVGELLQNADDADSPSVTFSLFGEYLVFSHSGKHFDEADVRGICDAASPDREKLKDALQIGNKGIGFKAVFSMAREVTVWSGECCFKFDEAHEAWQGKPKEYPWQIIPILTTPEALPQEIQANCSKEKVHTVFKIRPGLMKDIREHLSHLNSSTFLFLRHVKKGVVKRYDTTKQALKTQGNIILNLPEPKFEQSKKPGEGSVTTIKVSEKDTWWIYEKDCPLPETLKKALKTAPNVPAKYKTVTSMPIKIAVREHEGKLITPAASDKRVFCYLPTNLDYGFNFVFNAEFMLDSSRMQLRDDAVANAWNGFFLEAIAGEHVRFLSLMSAKSSLWRDIFVILTPDFNVPEKFEDRCDIAFNEQKNKALLVTEMTGEYVRTIRYIKVDTHGFVREFGSDAMKEKHAHHEIQNTKMLETLGAKRFQSGKIIDHIQTPDFLASIQDPQKNKAFHGFLEKNFSIFTEPSRRNFKKLLEKTPLILNNRNQLVTISDVQLPDEALKYALSKSADLSLIHPAILNEKSIAWFKRMGVKTVSLSHLVQIANNAPETLVALTHALAKRQSKFTHSDWQAVKYLKCLTKNSEVKFATSIFLNNAFNPAEHYEGFFSEHSSTFLHDSYSKEASPELFKQLKHLFVEMGLHQSLHTKNMNLLVNAVQHIASPNDLVALTMLFLDFFKRNEDKETLSCLKNLMVLTTKNEIVRPEQCYLADAYDPQSPMQILQPDAAFVSDAYAVRFGGNQNLKEFFLWLGVHEHIKFEVHIDKKREALFKVDKSNMTEYIEYLEANYPRLYDPPRTKGYLDQHSFEGAYLQVSFISSLLHTSMFWTLLKNHWDKFGRAIKIVKYHTAMGSKKVSSNVHMWVEKAIKYYYGDEEKVVARYGAYYKTFFNDYLPKGLPIAEITGELDFEQLETLGFKSQLSLAHCLSMLEQMANANKPNDDYEKIIFLYRQLLSSTEDWPEGVVDLSLLNRANTFAPVSHLHYLDAAYLPNTRNSRLIKKPGTIKAKAFERLCDVLKIKSIDFSELTVEPKERIHSELLEHFSVRFPYLLHALAKQQDWSLSDYNALFSDQVIEWINTLQKLTLQCAKQLNITFSDFLHESVDLWIDKDNNRLDHLPLHDLDHQATQTLYDFFYEYLGNPIEKATFISIMTSSEAKLSRQYEDELRYFDGETLTTAVDNARLNQACNPKKRTFDEGFSDDDPSPSREVAEADSASTSKYVKNHCFNGHSHPWKFLRTGASDVSTVSSSTASPAVVVPTDVTQSQVSTTQTRTGGFFSERLTHAQRVEMGKQGEERVYNFLKQKHTDKYGAANIAEVDNGYKITRADGSVKTVRWMNMQAESWKHYDFDITVQKGEQTKVRHLEVKTTTAQGAESVELTFSAEEWRQKDTDEQNGGGYRVYVVRASIEAGELAIQSPMKFNLEKDTARFSVKDTKQLRIKLT